VVTGHTSKFTCRKHFSSSLFLSLSTRISLPSSGRLFRPDLSLLLGGLLHHLLTTHHVFLVLFSQPNAGIPGIHRRAHRRFNRCRDSCSRSPFAIIHTRRRTIDHRFQSLLPVSDIIGTPTTSTMDSTTAEAASGRVCKVFGRKPPRC